jgi:hypothetical protein
MMYDLVTKQKVELTDDPEGDGELALNGNLLAFTRAEQPNPNAGYDLRLMNLDTGEATVLLPAEWLPIFPNLSERYLVFAAYSEDSTSIGRDIYYYDLEQMQLNHVWGSADVFCGLNTHWGEWILYVGNYSRLQPPFKVGLYHITTGEHIVLSDDEGAGPGYALHHNLAAWSTTSYSGTWYQGPVDIEVYEIGSALNRRITKHSSMLLPIAFHFPYLVIRDLQKYTGDPMRNDYYVAHLVKLGITDAEGNLLPGEGVIEPPQ